MSDHEIIREPDKDPTGGIELTDAELGYIVGGAQSGASVGCNTKTCQVSRGNSVQPNCCMTF